MLKNLSGLEYKGAQKIYHFMCDQDSPLNEIKDALFHFTKYVGQIEDAIKAQQAAEAQASGQENINPEQVSDGN